MEFSKEITAKKAAGIMDGDGQVIAGYAGTSYQLRQIKGGLEYWDVNYAKDHAEFNEDCWVSINGNIDFFDLLLSHWHELPESEWK